MAKIQHASAHSFAIDGNELVIGGSKISDLAARVGQTPFYAYERDAIADRMQHLRRHLPGEVEIHYAIKANPMPAVVHFISNFVDGLDVASGAEMLVALDSGMSAHEISMAGPGKSAIELEQAVAARICINAESVREIDLAVTRGNALGITPRLAVRVNPDFELKSSGMKMGGGPKQFGIDAERVPAAIQRIHELGAEFVGLQIYSGSQNLRAEAIVDAQAKTLDLATRLARDANSELAVLNLGGGFGVPYFPGDQPLDLPQVGEGLAERLETSELKAQGTRFVLELGRYIIAHAGIYVCRIVDRKVSRGQVFLITDGGLHHHLAASGNFGQVLRKNYPVAVGTRMSAQDTETASVVGPLCTPLDLLADRMKLAVASEGDLIVVFQSGAYGLTASPTRFLSHPAPIEVLV